MKNLLVLFLMCLTLSMTSNVKAEVVDTSPDIEQVMLMDDIPSMVVSMETDVANVNDSYLVMASNSTSIVNMEMINDVGWNLANSNTYTNSQSTFTPKPEKMLKQRQRAFKKSQNRKLRKRSNRFFDYRKSDCAWSQKANTKIRWR